MARTDQFGQESSSKVICPAVQNERSTVGTEYDTITNRDYLNKTQEIFSQNEPILTAINKKNEHTIDAINQRMDRLDKLLVNYPGADGLKESFANILYSNQVYPTLESMHPQKTLDTLLKFKRNKPDNTGILNKSLDVFSVKSSNQDKAASNKTMQAMSPFN